MTLLVVAAMLADLLTFALVVPLVGIGAELNPVMASGYAQHGLLVVAALKLAALAAIVLLVARVGRPRLRVLAASIGIVVGVTGAAGNVTAWAALTPRPAPESTPAASPRQGDGGPPRPSVVALARTGQPDSDHPGARPATPSPGRTRIPSRTVRMSASATGLTPAAQVPSGAAGTTLRGIASWFRSPSNVSAAGPRLRAALGPAWRGVHVRVCHADRCTLTVLGDTMRADRLVDLDDDAFRALAPLSVGVLAVTLTPIPAPPATTRETP
jgi:hypothetical protein